jgi:glutamine cyclotransferase
MQQSTAEVIREYGPFPRANNIGGVTYDGQSVWFAAGDAMRAFDPETGEEQRAIEVPAHAGTAFDGEFLYQIAEAKIQKIDPKTRRVVSTIPAPAGGGDSGLAWAEGTLWVGEYRARKIHQIDPNTGAIVRTIESNRFVTGVTWVEGELWHGTWEGEDSELRRVDSNTGGSRARRNACRRPDLGTRIGREGSILLWGREQRDGASGASAAKDGG